MLVNLPSVELAYAAYLPSERVFQQATTYFAIMYALPYHPISAIELKRAVILGIAYISFVSFSPQENHRRAKHRP
jgi:hypothetical protein